MTRYLCTVGTSASQDVLKAAAFRASFGDKPPVRLTAETVAQLGGEEAAFAAMRGHFIALDHRDDTTLRHRLSAEVHSLVRMKVSPADDVVLLATDTADGVVCARLVEAYLVDRVGLSADRVRVLRVEGLQVDDGERFRRVGIVNYIQQVRRLGDERAWQGVVLNPTGGYKALIPYTTLLGMLFGARVCYIFDNGRELIDLPPLPLEFNLPLLEPRRRALEELEEKVELTEDRFWAGAAHGTRERLGALVEITRPGWVALSGLGLVALERLRALEGHRLARIYLSTKAWEDLHRAPRDWDCLGQLETLAQSTRAQIDARIEKKHGDGTRWLKPGRTADRWRVEWEGDALLVYRILEHTEYERALGHTKWNRGDYAPFVPYVLPPLT
jgi:putative CRISPR-associated protein (TIGR02619 family)